MSDYYHHVNARIGPLLKCLRIADHIDRAAAVRAELQELAEEVASTARKNHERRATIHLQGFDYSDEDVRRLSRARF